MTLFGSRLVVFCLTVTLIGFSLSASQAQQSGSFSAGQLIEKLKAGGYILYIRHAATDHSQSDTDLSDFGKCQTQRNLSALGKQQALAMGAAIRELSIKIGTVYTSPYCRCVDTARIAFDSYHVDPELRATFFTDQAESRQLLAHLKIQLSRIPEAGSNTVLVGHTANLSDLTEVWPKPEGVTHVFKPLGEGRGGQHLGRILPTDWEKFGG